MLAIYGARPGTIFGEALQVEREHLRQGLAMSKLEGFQPTAADDEAVELLATGRITLEEYMDLALAIVRTLRASASSR